MHEQAIAAIAPDVPRRVIPLNVSDSVVALASVAGAKVLQGAGAVSAAGADGSSKVNSTATAVPTQSTAPIRLHKARFAIQRSRRLGCSSGGACVSRAGVVGPAMRSGQWKVMSSQAGDTRPLA